MIDNRGYFSPDPKPEPASLTRRQSVVIPPAPLQPMNVIASTAPPVAASIQAQTPAPVHPDVVAALNQIQDSADRIEAAVMTPVQPLVPAEASSVAVLNPNSTQVIVTPSGAITQGHPKFDKIMAVIAALIPLALAGASPFIKNGETGAIVADETPVAQALFSALSAL